jgi:hypothetical protein
MATKDEVPPEEGVLPDKVLDSFKRLSASAADLNKASDELGNSIEALDASLKRLGLGIAAWVSIAEGGDSHGSGYVWEHYLGYAKVGSKWGIALSSTSGNVHDDPHENDEEWLFAEAPRALRIQAVDHLPALLDKLIVEADKATEKIRGKINGVQTVVSAVKAAAQQSPAAKK